MNKKALIIPVLLLVFCTVFSACGKDEINQSPYSGNITVKQEYKKYDDTFEYPEFRNRVLELCNYERERAGLRPLDAGDIQSNIAAFTRAQEIPKDFKHERPDGRPWETVFSENGIGGWSQIGENLAYGFSTPEDLVKGWMDSKGHRENILRDWDTMSVGIYVDSKGVYWATQAFVKK